MAAQAQKRVNVSGTVTPELHEFLEEYRWSNRKSKSDVINEALVEWGQNHGYTATASTNGNTEEAATDEAQGPEDEAPKTTPEDEAPKTTPEAEAPKRTRRSR